MKWLKIRIIERIKLLIKQRQKSEVKSVIIIDKQCPHCASKGMFIFDSTLKLKNNKSEINEFHK